MFSFNYRNLNPFNFQNAGVVEISLQYAGRSLPGYPFTPEFGNQRFAREYINLMDNSGINQKDCGCSITRELFRDGCCLYAWDTSYVLFLYKFDVNILFVYLFFIFLGPIFAILYPIVIRVGMGLLT